MILESRIKKPGPKKILTLDGGGVRGIITLEVLSKLEDMLRLRLGADDSFMLCDYFDLVAGTSTGAIIAACLALGKSVKEIQDFYRKFANDMFTPTRGIKHFFRAKYDNKPLAEQLQVVFGDETRLGSSKLKTLLMMVMYNATTDSPWWITNTPFAKYNRRADPECNLKLKLWRLVLASTAAPVYFPPVEIGIKDDLFQDGGITPHNNPSFHAFVVSTLPEYGIGWEAGEDKILLVSVGTGMCSTADSALRSKKMNYLWNMTKIPSKLMYSASNIQDMLCRVFGECLAGDPIDKEIGHLIGSDGIIKPKLFTYTRYNASLDKTSNDFAGLPKANPSALRKLDSVDQMENYRVIGQNIAREKVKSKHFDGFIN